MRGRPQIPKQIRERQHEDGAEQQHPSSAREAQSKQRADDPGERDRRAQGAGENERMRRWPFRRHPGRPGHADDAAGGEKGMRLVKRMRDDVEHGEREGPEPALQHHETHLCDGRIRQRPLHTRLREHDHRGEEGREGADQREGIQRGGRAGDDGAEPHDEEAARIDDARVHQR